MKPAIDIPALKAEVTYTTSRSGGSGGQHVNKVETKVTLRFDVVTSAVLTEGQKAKVLARLKNDINKKKELVLHHETDRSQLTNKQKVTQKFVQLIKKALKEPKKRKATRPSATAIKKRIDNKRKRSEVKKMRTRPSVH